MKVFARKLPAAVGIVIIAKLAGLKLLNPVPFLKFNHAFCGLPSYCLDGKRGITLQATLTIFDGSQLDQVRRQLSICMSLIEEQLKLETAFLLDRGSTALVVAQERRGQLFILCGGLGFYLCMVSSIFLVLVPSHLGLPISLVAMIASFGCVGLVLTGRNRVLRRRKQVAALVAPLRLSSEEPPVVFLRSFKSDKRSESFWTTLPATVTQEEQLVTALRAFGPVIAMGRPEEHMPTLGAVRIYAKEVLTEELSLESAEDEEGWRLIVKKAIERAILVVIRFDRTPGLRWELEYALGCLPPSKIVLLVPAGLYSVLRHEIPCILVKAGRVGLGWQLPSRPALWKFVTLWRIWPVRWVRWALSFDADWKPSLRPCLEPLLYLNYTTPFVSGFQFALRPSIEALGKTWVPPKITFEGRFAVIFGSVLLALISLFCVFVISIYCFR
jgi:hypothetical protein